MGCEEPCVDEQIRLVDGDNATEGRVEICRDGSWGTICDNTASWGAEDARVVCKQLGLPYTGIINNSNASVNNVYVFSCSG